MSEKIVTLNEEVIKGQREEAAHGSEKETLNELPEREAKKPTQAIRYERLTSKVGFRCQISLAG